MWSSFWCLQNTTECWAGFLGWTVIMLSFSHIYMFYEYFSDCVAPTSCSFTFPYSLKGKGTGGEGYTIRGIRIQRLCPSLSHETPCNSVSRRINCTPQTENCSRRESHFSGNPRRLWTDVRSWWAQGSRDVRSVDTSAVVRRGFTDGYLHVNPGHTWGHCFIFFTSWFWEILPHGAVCFPHHTLKKKKKRDDYGSWLRTTPLLSDLKKKNTVCLCLAS